MANCPPPPVPPPPLPPPFVPFTSSSPSSSSSSNEPFQNDTVKSIVTQIQLIEPTAKVVTKGNVTQISNFIISEQDVKNLVIYSKDVFNPDTKIRGINLGTLDKNAKFKRLPSNVLLTNKIVFCKKFNEIMRLKRLEKSKNPSDTTSSSMNIGDFYDTSIVDEINVILGYQPTKFTPKYCTAISLESRPGATPAPLGDGITTEFLKFYTYIFS